MSLTTNLSSLSYTNKDFNSIYTELLEYAKKISYKWDPSASDESDPGVVLLKLAALIGDKNNYNIDKSILELMPGSVTQLPAARQLFEQCGYSMKYYQAATGYISLTVSKLPSGVTEPKYVIPAFTMVTDNDSSVVYTVSPLNNSLILTEDKQSFEVIEGSAVQYTINNDPLISVLNLDNKNRLYFTDTNVAENGIFITNSDTVNYDEWIPCDNLEVMKKGTRCYKFGLTLDSGIPYIEFPRDVEAFWGSGLNITYIKTSGKTGNIAAKKLRKFLSESTFNLQGPSATSTTDTSISSNDIIVRNDMPILNGKDPQTIDEAYVEYKRVKDTFNTLVTLKDYTDFMLTNKQASNGYVCDRTNDIQRSYKIYEIADLVSVLTSHVDMKTEELDASGFKDQNDNPLSATTLKRDVQSMSPYDLCIYALKYTDITGIETFRESFNLVDGSDYEKFLREEDVASLQHNFLTYESNKILMIKNKYRMKIHVIPRYRLGEDIYEVRENIRKALYESVNSKKLTFGTAVSYETLYDTINSADERIKAASVDYPEYETYVVYKDAEGNFKELRIDMGSDLPLSKEERELWEKAENNLTDEEKTRLEVLKSRVALWRDFRSEIFVKNALSGVTPIYDTEHNFSYGMNQKEIVYYNDGQEVVSITTNTTLEPTEDGSVYTYNRLRENEAILLTCPNYIPESKYPSFSSYVKIIRNFTNTISANDTYELKGDDYIIFFWKKSQSDTYYSYVKYDKSDASLAKYISPTFDLKNSNTNHSEYDSVITNLPTGIEGTLSSFGTFNEFVAGLESTEADTLDVLTGTNVINLLTESTIQINNTTNGSSFVYWLVNNSDNKIKWTEVKDTAGTLIGYTYSLKSGEYFFYTNEAKTSLNLLSEGTILQHTFVNDTTLSNLANWKIDAVKYESILLNGIDAIPEWFKIPLSSTKDINSLTATETQQILLGSGNQLILTKDSSTTDTTTTALTLDSTEFKGVGEYKISYNDDQGKLHAITNSGGSRWQAKTILNINMSSTIPQILLSGQSFELYDVNNSQIDTNETDEGAQSLAGGDKDTSVTPITDNRLFILCDKAINKVGGDKVNVQTYSLSDNKYEGCSLLVYKTQPYKDNIAEQNTTGLLYNDSTQVVSVTFKSNDGTNTTSIKTLKPFELVRGDYLVQLKQNNDLTSLMLSTTDPSTTGESTTDTDSNVILTPVYGPNAKLNYFYKLSVTDTTKQEITLYITGSTTKNSVEVFIQPLYKYTSDTLDDINKKSGYSAGTSFEKDVLDKISNYDRAKNFDYSLNRETVIKNPLESRQFHNVDHFYNKFTIDEWYEFTDDITISTSIR